MIPITSEPGDGHQTPSVPWWKPVLLAALAGGMGWGIRGQYGHETGAMIAGLLIGLVLLVLLGAQLTRATAARALAWVTIAIGFGGSMTYGQTVGLTHDAPLIGNWQALSWGMLGLAIKGAIWIGFAGLFLGMGLGGVRYRPAECLLMMLAAVALYHVGVWLLNSPFNPAERELPLIYFSDHWRWEPEATLKPRRECWGGLLLALAGLWAYVGRGRKDALAARLAGWAALGGCIGFPLGQSLQAFHAWNPDMFTGPFWSRLDPHMNWWNFMEITFGAVAGAFLGLGLWRNRARIRNAEAAQHWLPAWVPAVLLAVHLPLLIGVEFLSIAIVDALYDLGLVLGIIPVVAVSASRWWPYALVLPVTLLPIAGKTVRQLVFQEQWLGPVAGWALLFVLPMMLAIAAAWFLARQTEESLPTRRFAAGILVFSTVIYFGLNFAFFHLPWPWADWTGRTPSGIVFTICTAALLGLATTQLRRGRV